jgi:SWI/SNF-related matrix-associated actin-dependent regulator 1 of chromatin subfamily A
LVKCEEILEGMLIQLFINLIFLGSSNTAELKLILEEMVLIRHEKKEIMDQLVKKTREKVILKKQLLDLSADSLGLAADRMHAAKGGIEQRGALITYFHETCKAKCQAVSDYVLTLLKESRKIIVFAHHKEMLDELEKTIEKTKYKYIRIDGSTNSKKRQIQVNMFQNKDDFVCALLSITAAG